MIDESQLREFQNTVWEYYGTYSRDLPWRRPESDGRFDPYKILVSEVMLQQTQVSRAIPKYKEFLQLFPATTALAQAEQGEVLRAWSGLGYNRRAKFLHQAARQIVAENSGNFPALLPELVKLPGVGANTAGAILAYAFNQPVVFIETNIRTVFIHHFFHDQTAVTDRQLLFLIGQTLDKSEPRQWYWALMDYGSHLKQAVGNTSRQSKTYTRQSVFQGSSRQIRGQILKLLSEEEMTLNMLSNNITDQRLEKVVDDLLREKLISKNGKIYRL